MKRPLTLQERALYGRVFNVMVTACIHGHIAEQRMQKALAMVQAKHSILRCLIVQDGDRPAFVLQDRPSSIPLRIVERQTDEDWVEVSMQESLEKFDGSKDPLARVIWLRGAEKSELLLVCHHAICDGRSLLILLSEILLLCDQPEADIGTPTSFNAIQEIFPPELLKDRGLQWRIRCKVLGIKLLLKFFRPRRTWSYGKIYRNFWTLDEAASRLLVARCKAEGVNVTSALAVAFVQVFHTVCGRKHIKKFFLPIDIRKFLPQLRMDSLYAIAPTIHLRLRKPRSGNPGTADFWTQARAMKADMTGKIDKVGPTIFSNILGTEQLHDVYDRMASCSQSLRAGRTVALSYLGRVELPQEYRDFRLQAIHDISAMLEPTPANLVVIYSFAGKFHCLLASDESSLPYAQALQIKEQVMSTLISCVTESEIRATIPIGTSTVTSSARAEVS